MNLELGTLSTLKLFTGPIDLLAIVWTRVKTSAEIPKFHDCKYLKLSPFMFVTLVNAVLGHSETFLTMFHRKTRLSDKMPLEILLI